MIILSVRHCHSVAFVAPARCSINFTRNFTASKMNPRRIIWNAARAFVQENISSK